MIERHLVFGTHLEVRHHARIGFVHDQVHAERGRWTTRELPVAIEVCADFFEPFCEALGGALIECG